jgi:NTP pyrophosphatase (non-canonical NTP hydrolase)
VTRTEHLLSCLAEECNEVAQRVSKALRFGLSEVQKGQDRTNAQRVVDEFIDLLSVMTVLHREGVLVMFHPSERDVAEKLAKIERHMEISRDQGVLQG